MTAPRPSRSPFRPRAGSAITALFLGSLAITAISGFVPGSLGVQPAAAQSAANSNDQPTAGTLPGRDGAGTASERPTGQVAPPSAISSSTDVMAGDAKRGARTNPLDHLPARDRAATGGTRRD